MARLYLPLQHCLGNRGAVASGKGHITLTPSTSWWAATTTTLTFIQLVRLQEGKVHAAGSRLLTRETTTGGDGTYLATDTAVANGCRFVVNRNTSDLRYSSAAAAFVPGEWAWLVTCMDTAAGTALKVRFYRKPFGPKAGIPVSLGVTGTSEGSGTIAHGTANPMYIFNGPANNGGGGLDVAFFGIWSGAAFTAAEVTKFLPLLEGNLLAELARRRAVGPTSAKLCRLALFPGNLWVGSTVLDTVGGLLGTVGAATQTGFGPRPWPQPRYVNLGRGSAGGAVNVTPVAGVMTLTVPNPTVTQGAVSVTPTAAVATFTGTVPTVTLGALSLTPVAALVTFAVPALTVTKGAVSATPTSALVTFTVPALAVTVGAVSPSPVAALVTFAAPNPIISAGTIVSPTSALFTFVATAPTVGIGALSLVPVAGVATFTATAPTLTVGAVSATPPSALVTFAVPALAVTRGAVSVTPTAALVTFTATAPTLTLGAVSPVPASALVTFVVPNPAVSGGIIVTPVAALVTFAVTSPTVTAGTISLTPVAALLTFVATAPTLTLGAVSPSPTSAIFTFTVPNPAVSGAVVVTPVAGVLTFTVPAPTLTLGAVTSTPASALFTFAVPNPAVTSATVVTPTAALFSLTGKIPVVTVGTLQVTPSVASFAFLVAAPNVAAGSVSAVPASAVFQFVAPAPTATLATQAPTFAPLRFTVVAELRQRQVARTLLRDAVSVPRSRSLARRAGRRLILVPQRTRLILWEELMADKLPNFDLKRTAEKDTFAFDLVNELDVGETLSTSATWVIAVAPASPVADATPLAMLSGSPSILGSKVFQKLMGGVSGAQYIVSAAITTSTGKILEPAALLTVENLKA